MKVVSLEKVKFAPGKWEEAGKLMMAFQQMAEKNGFPKYKIYSVLSGEDVVQTLYFQSELESLSQMESLLEKMFSDPETRVMMGEWAGVVASHEVTILKELSEGDLGT